MFLESEIQGIFFLFAQTKNAILCINLYYLKHKIMKI